MQFNGVTCCTAPCNGLLIAPALRHTRAMNDAAEPLTEPRVRLTAADWELAALDVLAESGLAAIAVESLARTLGVTKGSFYWHFPTREALVRAAVDRWEKRDEDEVLARIEPIADPRERLRELFRRVSREVQSHVIYAALLQASDHPLVHPVIERISKRRLDLLTLAYRQTGFERRIAGYRARLAYTAYTGFLQLNQRRAMPRMDQEDYEAYVEHVIEALIPA